MSHLIHLHHSTCDIGKWGITHEQSSKMALPQTRFNVWLWVSSRLNTASRNLHGDRNRATPLKCAIVWTFRPWSFESFLSIWRADPKQSSRDSFLSLWNSRLFSRVPKGGDKLCQIMSNHFRPWSSSFHCVARCHLSLCCNIKFTPCVPYMCLLILGVLSLWFHVKCQLSIIYAPIVHPYTSWRFTSHVSNLSPSCFRI